MKRFCTLQPLLSTLVVLAGLAGLLVVCAPSAALADNSNGDMVVFGGQHETVKPGQEVSGDLVVIGGSADVFGKVDGDAVAIGGKIYIAPQGHVDGSLVNLGGVIDNESSLPQGHRMAPPPPPPLLPTPEPMPEQRPAPRAGGWTAFIFIDALLALLAFLLFPTRTRSATDHLLDNPVMAGMLGFFSPIIFVLVIIALAITIIGIPLLPLAVIVTIIGYLVGKAAIAEFLGQRLFDVTRAAHPKPITTVLLGLLILAVVSAFTGWVGVVFYYAVMALAVGASLYALMRTAQAYRRPPAVTPPAPPAQFSPPVGPAPTGPPAVP